ADSATINVADTINTLPAFAPTTTNESAAESVSAANQGITSLNLRDMGSNRTLVLFDGMRSVTSDLLGDVDVSDFPQQLISRVDTGTGGGSSVYGSDAVAGVVNFVLNRTFTGFLADLSAGQTAYGDDQSAHLSVSWGARFDENRGHVLLSG